jgi:hypothetical protein
MIGGRSMQMNLQEWLWSGLAGEARAAAEKIDHQDVQVRVLLDAARYKVLATRAAQNRRSNGSDEI